LLRLQFSKQQSRDIYIEDFRDPEEGSGQAEPEIDEEQLRREANQEILAQQEASIEQNYDSVTGMTKDAAATYLAFEERKKAKTRQEEWDAKARRQELKAQNQAMATAEAKAKKGKTYAAPEDGQKKGKGFRERFNRLAKKFQK
jgi:hypothetical protein